MFKRSAISQAASMFVNGIATKKITTESEAALTDRPTKAIRESKRRIKDNTAKAAKTFLTDHCHLAEPGVSNASVQSVQPKRNQTTKEILV